MNSFNCNGKEIEFSSISGVVLGSNKSSETHISSTGGISYYAGNNTVASTPVRVSSTITTKHEIWIRTDSGQEKSIRLINTDIPLREGQTVCVVYMADAASDVRWPYAFINYTANTCSEIMKPVDLVKEMKVYPMNMGSIVKGLVLLAASTTPLLFISIPALIFLWRRRYKRGTAMVALCNEKGKEFVKKMLDGARLAV